MTHASAIEFARLHTEISATPFRDRVRKAGEFFGKLNELSRHGTVIKTEVQHLITLPEPNWVSFVEGDEVTIRSGDERQVVSLSSKRMKVETQWFFTRARSVRAVDTLFREDEPEQLTRASLSDTDEYSALYRSAAEAHMEWKEARFKTLYVPAVVSKVGDDHTLFLDLSSVDVRFQVEEPFESKTRIAASMNWIEIDESVSDGVRDEFRAACENIRRVSGSPNL